MAKRRRRASRAGKPGAPSLLRAEAFELVGNDGRVHARLGAVPGAGVEDHGVGLQLFEAGGDVEVVLSVDSDGPALHLLSEGNVRLSLAVLRTGGGGARASVLIAARDARGRALFAVSI